MMILFKDVLVQQSPLAAEDEAAFPSRPVYDDGAYADDPASAPGATAGGYDSAVLSKTDEGAASGNGSPASSSSSQGRPGGRAGVVGSSGSASPDSSRGAVRPFAHGHASPPAPPPRASHDGEPRHGDHEAPRQAGGGEPGRDPRAPAGEHADGAGPLDSPAIRRARRGSVHSPQAVAASSIHTAVIAALEGGALDTAKPGGRELLGAIKQMLGAMSQAAQANRELRARVEELVMRVTQLRHATMEAAADS